MEGGYVRCIVGSGLHSCCRHEADNSCGVGQGHVICRSHGDVFCNRRSDNRITRNCDIPGGCSSFSCGESDCRTNRISILGRGHGLCRGTGLAAISTMRTE